MYTWTLLYSLGGHDGCFVGHIGADRVNGFPLGSGANVGVVLQHRAVQVAGNRHDGLV